MIKRAKARGSPKRTRCLRSLNAAVIVNLLTFLSLPVVTSSLTNLGLIDGLSILTCS